MCMRFGIGLLLIATACASSSPSTPSAWDVPTQATASQAHVTTTPSTQAFLTVQSQIASPMPRHTQLPTAPITLMTLTPMPMSDIPVTATPDFSPVSENYELPPTMPFTTGQVKTEFGIQINGCDHDPAISTREVKAIGFTWIKQQVRWGDMSSQPGQMDWSCLDRVIPAAHTQGLKVLLSVTTAPVYLRTVMRDTQGAPDRVEDFGLFIYDLLTRYRGQVHGIEIWNEPNINAEWNDIISVERYIMLLTLGYGIARYVDPQIIVISAGLAPTGFNSVWTHVDDVGFLSKLIEQDGLNRMDCVGAHANGPEGNGDLDTLSQKYFEITQQTKPICLTEFGYALPINNQAPKGFDWIMPHTAEQQTATLVNGLKWAAASGYVRLVIVWNYDVYGALGYTDLNAPYALLRPNWRSPTLNVIYQYLLPRP